MSFNYTPPSATGTGGLEYKGTFDASTGLPDLSNAEQGDLYVISVAGTIYGQTWAIGDHLLINEDMGGTITNSKIDKVDNTDAVTSVNGLVGTVVLSGDDIAADHTASNYTPTNANIDGHLAGIDSQLGAAAPVDSVNGQTGVVSLGLDDLNDVNLGTPANAEVLTYNSTAGEWQSSAAPGGFLTAVQDDSDPTLGGNLKVNGFSITSVSNGNVTIDPNGTGDIATGADIIPDADFTYTIGDEDFRFHSFGTLNGAVRFKAKNDSGGTMTRGQVVYIKGISGTVPTVDLARANAAATMPAFGLVWSATANDQAEVQIVTFGQLEDANTSTLTPVNSTLYVSAATAGALTVTAPTGETNFIQNIGRVLRVDASAGVIRVGGAGRSNATPNLNTDNIFIGDGSNQAVTKAISTIELDEFSNTTSGFIKNVVEDLTPQLGGNIDTNSKEIVSVSNADIVIAPNGTGSLVVKDEKSLKFNESSNTYSVAVKAPNTLAASYSLTLPLDDGTASQLLSTDGNGVLSWADALLVAQNLADLNNVATARDNLNVEEKVTYQSVNSSPVTGAINYHYSVDTSGGAITINLPAISGLSTGQRIYIKLKTAGNDLTLTPNATAPDTIDGQSSYVLDVQYSALTLVVGAGSNWEII